MPQEGADLLRIVVAGPAGYAAMVLLLRASGKRALTSMNAFDVVVTVSLGAILASIVLRQVSLAEGLVGLSVLIGAQHVLTLVTSRSARASRLVKADPRVLVQDGRPLHTALRDERVSEHELRAAARASGRGSLEELGAIVLESDGRLSVLRADEAGKLGELR